MAVSGASDTVSGELRDALETVFINSFVEDSMSPPIVLDVRRVSNEARLSEYLSERARLAERSHPRVKVQTQSDILSSALELDSGVNEVLLFHGTPASNVDGIVRDGFLISKSRSGVFGKGIYLADYAFKASTYTGYHGSSTVIVCRALMGTPKKFMHGAHGLRAPPEYSERSFDSVLGIHPKQVGGRLSGLSARPVSRASLREFVLFDPKKVYPEFVITYRC